MINSVQEAIAGELDPQAIYDAVGDRIRDVFDAQVVSIATLDDASGLIHYPYLIERGERLQAEPRPLAGFAKHVLETREPLLIAEDLDAESERYGSSVVAGERPKSVLFVPLVAGGRAAGVISLQNIDREHAFDEDDQRLLTTLAGSLSVALENARLVQETRQRVGRAGDGEQRRPGALVAARPRRADRARRRAGSRDVRRRHRLCRPARRGRRTDRVRLLLRERRAPAGGAHGVRRGSHLSDPRSRASRCCTTGESSTRDRRSSGPRPCPTSAFRSSSAAGRSA